MYNPVLEGLKTRSNPCGIRYYQLQNWGVSSFAQTAVVDNPLFIEAHNHMEATRKSSDDLSGPYRRASEAIRELNALDEWEFHDQDGDEKLIRYQRQRDEARPEADEAESVKRAAYINFESIRSELMR